MKFATLASALFAATLAVANPIQHDARDIWNPKMTYPNANTTWVSGSKETVKWSIADAPKRITGQHSGFIQLRFGEIESPIILAHGIDLLAGQATVTVPDVFTRNDFSLVLQGDSGNWGDYFTITGPDGL